MSAYGTIDGRENASASFCSSIPTSGTFFTPGDDVQVDRRPASGRRHDDHPGIGVDDDRVTDGRQQRGVVDAVRVGVAGGEVDAVLVGPLAHGRQLAGRPDERPGEIAAVGVVVRLDAVPRRHDAVEAEPVGERLDEVVRRGRGQHDRASLVAVHREHRLGERLHHVDESVGDAVGGFPDRRPGPALGEIHRLAGERHRRQRLAHRVEQLVEHLLAGDAPAHQTGGSHGVGEDLATGTPQQRAVEVEEGSSG